MNHQIKEWLEEYKHCRSKDTINKIIVTIQ